MPVRVPIIARLPACILMLVVVVYTLSFCTGRMVLVEGSVVALLLLPCLWLLAMPATAALNATTGWFLVIALALEGWMAGVQALSHDAIPAGWWCFAERAAGLSTLVLLVSHQLPIRVLVQLLGAAASCTLVVCAVMNGSLDMLHPLETNSYAFGHVNILANTAGPSLLAWVVLLAAEWWSGKRPCVRDLVLAGCGLISVTIITVTTQRRGVVLAFGAACVFLVIRWLLAKHRALGLAVLAMVLLSIGGLAVRQFTTTVPSLRAERVALYRSGVDGIIAGAPFGFGHYGALHLQTVETESCRHMTADGGYGEDIHNQLLECALDGGPVALVLVLALIALVATRVITVSDSALRHALEAMGVAIVMHLLTDNVYGTEVGVVWLAVAVGIMLTAESTRPALPMVPWLPSVRMLAWPLALVSLCGALLDLRAALLPIDAGATDQFRCLQTAFVPQSVSLHAEAIIQSNDQSVDRAMRDAALDLSVARMGWTIRTAIFEAERRRQTGPPAVAIPAMLRVLRLSPFFREYYESLSVYCAQHPEGERLLPADVHQRLAYLRGGRSLPRPVLSPSPRFIDEAIDEYTAIIWSISNDVPWTQISSPLHGLMKRYGDIPGVAQLTFMAVCAAPPDTFPWLHECIPQIAVAVRGPGAILSNLSMAQTPEQARRIEPIAEQLYPEVFATFKAGTMHMTNNPMGILIHNALARLWGLAQRPPGKGPVMP